MSKKPGVMKLRSPEAATGLGASPATTIWTLGCPASRSDAAQNSLIRRGRRDNAGQRRETGLHHVPELGHRHILASGLPGNRPHQQIVLPIETEVFPLEIGERPGEQAGADQQKQRQCDLRDDQQRARGRTANRRSLWRSMR